MMCGDAAESADWAIRPGGAHAFGAMPAWDAHCHLDFAADPHALAQAFAQAGRGALSCTVDPASYERVACLLAGVPNVRAGLGLHPWWVADDAAAAEAQIACFEEAVGRADFIGEVGLDFAARHVQTAELQRRVFSRVVRATVAAGGTVLSIHAVRAAGEVLDILERERAFDACICIMHWFSGTSDELYRAIRLGCRFSVGERMLATKRGCAYVRTMPPDRLLLETDLPTEGGSESFSDMASSLGRAFDSLVDLRGDAVAQRAGENAQRLFG